jgi:hypothetical protein
MENIGIIILDEEHENSYKSETTPRYHAQEVARWLAEQEKCLLLLASATPSVSDYFFAKSGEYLLLEMKKRLSTLPLAVDLPDFYPVWKKEGKLSQGSVKDFSAIGNVRIRCTGNVPTQLVQLSRTAFSGNKDLTAVIPLADHTSVRSGALRRRDWNDLVRALEYFISSTRKTGCSGVVLRPFSELSYMLLEKD